MIMARPGFPYVPNMEDCKQVTQTDGCTCYIMDTVCRHTTAEEMAEIDRQIVQIAINAALRKRAAERSV